MHDAIMGSGSDLRYGGELVAFFEEHPRPYRDDYPYTSESCVMLPDHGGEFAQQLQSDALFNFDVQPFWSSICDEANTHEFATSSTLDVAAEAAKIGAGNGMESSPSCEGDNANNSRIGTSKRRAQNRSAQRSLRQRKLQHVRDLETGINLLHDKQSLLHSNNELLKLQLDDLKIENQVLHASIRPPPVSVDGPISVRTSRGSRSSMSALSSSMPTNFNTPMTSSCCSSPESESTASAQETRVPIPRRAHKKSKTGCRTCKQRKVKCDERRPLCLNCERHFTNLQTCDFDEQTPTLQVLPIAPTPKANRRPSTPRDTKMRTRRTLVPKEQPEHPTPAEIIHDGLTINAAWQLLQNHPQYLLDRVDVTAFCEGLRKLAAFDGKALVFERANVLNLIEEHSQL
ncbi:hypothetical protein LTR56_002677 [Elasticomyces elasticus]|nr:hypothetical protein LTR22_014907 [Elasticomyces elasticus]KAK3657161.1 hypothetical protein LTR56_002677 [Elasticomyces elasticus]KAK4914366.1 hypothetical protein LTR49_017397 [Elasticomyces elasticus]KAK5753853.1 hypothetical protein LTS12_016056 [Elasticomyces elasticus]